MDSIKINDSYNWSVEKGDYVAEEDPSEISYKEITFRKKVKQIILAFLYCCAVSLFTYFILWVF